MNIRRALVLATSALLVATIARSGHEQPVYPSYYPHEIEIAAIPPERAPELMRAGKLHAYVGASPRPAGAPPNSLGTVESLGSFVLVRLNPQSPLARDEASACATAESIARAMAARAGDLIEHFYPVTPYHGDYLNHADLAEAANARLLAGAAALGDVKVRAESAAARRLVRPEWLAQGAAWDAAIEEVGAGDLVAAATVSLNGWTGPRWVRSGWFHAYRLLAEAIGDAENRQRMAARLERLQAGAYDSAVERINLERELVQSLASSCRLMVVGYTVKREIFNADFSTGIENIGFDALEGFSSPMFLRTVKLKDFPWNGWLQLGVGPPPVAAWNPIGGFTDDFGRLIWFAIGDPAAIPSPYESAWMLNRISEVEHTPRR